MAQLDTSLLTHVSAFDGLCRTQIREILDEATPRRIDEGAAIFREGHADDRFFLLLDGYVRVVRTTEGGDQVIALHIPAGQLFGIARAIGRDTYPATAQAAAESLVLHWPTTIWDRFVETYPNFGQRSTQTVGVRLGEMQSRILELATLQVEQRIAQALLRLITQTGRKTEDGIEIDFPITRQDLSDMTGTTLHTVSRLLSAWQKDGMIESRRKRIKVLDPHRLMVFSQRRG